MMNSTAPSRGLLGAFLVSGSATKAGDETVVERAKMAERESLVGATSTFALNSEGIFMEDVAITLEKERLRIDAENEASDGIIARYAFLDVEDASAVVVSLEYESQFDEDRKLQSLYFTDIDIIKKWIITKRKAAAPTGQGNFGSIMRQSAIIMSPKLPKIINMNVGSAAENNHNCEEGGSDIKTTVVDLDQFNAKYFSEDGTLNISIVDGAITIDIDDEKEVSLHRVINIKSQSSIV